MSAEGKSFALSSTDTTVRVQWLSSRVGSGGSGGVIKRIGLSTFRTEDLSLQSMACGVYCYFCIIQGVARHRSHFQISKTFSNFNVLTKFKHRITKKGWEFFLILIENKSWKNSVFSSCSSGLV